MLTAITALFFHIRENGNPIEFNGNRTWALWDETIGEIRASLVDEGYTVEVSTRDFEASETLRFPMYMRKGSRQQVDSLCERLVAA